MEADKTERKRKEEEKTVTEMIRLYCHGNHHKRSETEDLCPQCDELARYARSCSEHCPFMETKTFCSACKVHCYSPEMRMRIKAVMRYSGPRMLLYHPLMTFQHLIVTIQSKRK